MEGLSGIVGRLEGLPSPVERLEGLPVIVEQREGLPSAPASTFVAGGLSAMAGVKASGAAATAVGG